MRFDPSNLTEEERLEEEKRIQERLSLIIVFCSVFGFLIKIMFL